MGSSWTVSCKSKKAQAEMLAFLEEHHISSSQVFGKPDRFPNHPAEYTKYARTTTSIGFNGPGDHENAVLRWIAFRVGKKRTFKKKLGPDAGAVPWLNMDNQGSLPVITRDQWDGRERTEQYIVDDIGWQGLRRWWEDYVPNDKYAEKLAEWVKDADGKDRLIRTDIERFDRLWGFRASVAA